MSIVTSSGATWAAARSSAVLYDAARRLPEIPRILIELGGLDGGHAHQQLDLVGDEEVAVGKGLVPLEVEVAAVDRAGELEADALVAPRILAVLGDLAGELDRLGDALDGDLALEGDAAAGAHLGRGGGEADLGLLVGVEELGALEVPVAVGVAGIDGGDVHGALQHGGAGGGVDLALEGAEATPDGGDPHVLDLKADA